MNYSVAWTVPYQPSWIDKHDLEPELLCWAMIQSASGDAANVLAHRRKVSNAEVYEPVYFEFRLGDREPYFDVVEFDNEHDVELDRSLPETVTIVALTRDVGGAPVIAKPVPVRIECDDEAEEIGIGLSYALHGVQSVEPYRGESLPPLLHRIRTVFTEGESRSEPLYLHWGS